MSDIVRILLISLLSLAIISCSAKDKSESSASNMKLSDIQSNLNNKNTFITSGKNNYSNFRSNSNIRSKRYASNVNNPSSINSLVVIDDDGKIDYGLLSNYDLQIDKVVVDPKNEYSYVLLKFDDGGGTSSDSNIRAINCTILKINIENGEMSCLVNGIIIMSQIKHARFTRDAYTKPVFQFSNNGNIYFRGSTSYEGLTAKSELGCYNSDGPSSCLYEHVTSQGVTTKLNNEAEQEISRLLTLENGQVVFTGWKLENGKQIYKGSQPVHSEIIIRDSDGEKYELTSTNPSEGGGFHKDINKGDYVSLIYGSEKSSNVVITRLTSGNLKKTYLNFPFSTTSIIKSESGEIYSHARNDGLYRLLPKSKKIIDNPSGIKGSLWNNERCGSSLTCFIYYKIINGIVFYNHINYSYTNKPTTIKATRLSDNKTISVINPDSGCTNNCYKVNFINKPGASTAAYKLSWFNTDKKLYISMKNMITSQNEIIEINSQNLNFESNENQYTILNDIGNNLSSKKLTSVTSKNNLSSSSNISGIIDHEDNDTSSIRIEFSNKMNYSDVESKVSIVDNSTNNNVGFMPLWNNKTLHLVIDTDNGTVFDDNVDPLTSGKTYKVTLSGSAKDLDGKTIGSDVVKYITP